MYEERRRILEMVASGKITSDEAEELLNALDADRDRDDDYEKDDDSESDSFGPGRDHDPQPGQNPRFLKILVIPGHGAHGNHGSEIVKIKIPLALMRAGMKMSSLIPEQAREKIETAFREKGINFNFANMKPEQFDEIMAGLKEFQIKVIDGDEVVRISCE
ncbi:conserved hypothetical protein [Candidatus Zixiibacteriota bacterium]|nr:conserved hypothetical protein [candidate division Zixibacteria bacterium]